ncbi:hypothetical protein PFISCL1PPCAC_5742, partial [Pristionchus fissidentatus]
VTHLSVRLRMSALRVFSRLATVSRRGFAAAAAAKPSHGAEDLRLTFASPDKAYFTDASVKQVDVPTLAGTVGILANHVPTIGVLKPGVVTVTDSEGKQVRLFVSSGTLSMNIDGSCQVLAEEVVKVEDIDENLARQELESAQRASSEGSEVARAEAGIRAEVAEALVKAVSGH